MPTNTTVKGLNINELTEAQYDAAVQGGVIGPNELSVLTDVSYVEPSDLATVATTGDYDDLINKPTIPAAIQVSNMPVASVDELDKIYQFIGATDATYTNGYFYKCVSDGQTPATYSWEQIDVMPAGSSLPDQTGQSGKFLTTDGSSASWAGALPLTGGELSGALEITKSASGKWLGLRTTESWSSSGCYVILGGANVGAKRYAETQLNVGPTSQYAPFGAGGFFDYYYDYTNSNARIARFFAGGNSVNITELGGPIDKWTTIYVTKINNGADITVPNQAGTMVVADSTSATAGQVLTLDSNLQPVWQAGGGGLPSQTGNAGKFLTTDGTDASWGDALVNTATGTNSLAIGNNNTTTNLANSVIIGHDSYTNGGSGSSVAIGKGVSVYTECVGVGSSSSAVGLGAIAIGANSRAVATRAIQIGYGSNSESGTLYVGLYHNSQFPNYKLLSSDGTIPTARLTKVNSTITLTAAGWSSNTQTVAVNGVTSTSVVFVAPDPADTTDYVSAGILCTSQTTNSLTFTATTTPTSDIAVNVVCL